MNMVIPFPSHLAARTTGHWGQRRNERLRARALVCARRAGVESDVYTRAESPDLPAFVEVEPGFTVHHVTAGPVEPVDKGRLHELTAEFTEAVTVRIAACDAIGTSPTDAIHANYWVSGISGHALKHRLGIPLFSTFHTLDRVKAEASPDELDSVDPNRRASRRSGCHRVLRRHSGLMFGRGRSTGRALWCRPFAGRSRCPGRRSRLLFAGRQGTGAAGAQFCPGRATCFVRRSHPAVEGRRRALRTLAELERFGLGATRLAIVGGPSGSRGDAEMEMLRALVGELGLGGKVDFIEPRPHELLSTFYRAADVCLVPSRSE